MYVHRQGPLRHCKPAKTLTTSCTLPSLLLPYSPCNKHPHFPARPARLVCIHHTHTPPTPTVSPPLPPVLCPHAPNVDLELFRCTAPARLLLLRSRCHPRSFALACLPGGGLPLRSPTAPALCSQLPPVKPASVLSTRAILTARTSTITHPNPASLPKHSPALPDHTRPLKVEQRSPLLIFSRRFTQCHNATKLGKRGSTTASPAGKVHRRLSLGALRSPCATRPPCNHVRAFFSDARAAHKEASADANPSAPRTRATRPAPARHSPRRARAGRRPRPASPRARS